MDGETERKGGESASAREMEGDSERVIEREGSRMEREKGVREE